MTNQKLFSIIIATYNCGSKIENTLQSIFSQNKDLFELIILDGASTDGTLQYIGKYADDLILISEKDDGIYSAFNKGIELATGKYIYFIGAGDCLKAGILDRVKEFMPLDEPSLVYGQCYFVKQKKIIGQEVTRTFFTRENICQQGIFYHRAIFDIIGKYELKYKVFADWFLNIKCFINDEISKRYIDYVIADYEEGGVSSLIDNDPLFRREFPPFVRKEFGFFKYFLCRTYFIEPYIFSCIGTLNFRYLPEYLRTKYTLLGYLASVLKTLKKTIKNKT